MSGILYIVATPIGNLDDITLRAIKTLKEVDRIAAEDTRHSGKLLAHLGISKPMVSLHEHNERERAQQILNWIGNGESIALVSDAGTPLISDPGFPLVKAARDAGITVIPVPGVSSIITALSAAGLPTDRFCFHGFLSHKKAEREQQLVTILNMPGTQVMLESTHRIQSFLQQLDGLQASLEMVLAKELTKQYEAFLSGTASELLNLMQRDPGLVKGEFVVLIPGASQSQSNLELPAVDLLERLLKEMPLKKAVMLAVDLGAGRKNDLYQMALEISAPQAHKK